MKESQVPIVFNYLLYLRYSRAKSSEKLLSVTRQNYITREFPDIDIYGSQGIKHIYEESIAVLDVRDIVHY